jgi:anti-sigma regulatory factor (Ser/Thr protein kinase)
VKPEDAERDGIDAIYDAHTRVVTTLPSAAERDERAEFPGRPNSIRAARHFAREVFGNWGLDGHAEVGLLIVSELATNAVVHARSDFEVRLQRTGSAVRISVRDASSSLPEPRPFSADSISGRGLAIVTAFSDRWGSQGYAGGKEVWADITV